MKNKRTSTGESGKELKDVPQDRLAPYVSRSDNNDLEKDRLLQELQVHQFELEMQNDELRRTNEELEMQRIRFLGIYELAPIGYFILDNHGNIRDVNSAGSQLLDIDKADLLGRRFISFIEITDRDHFHRFFHDIIDRHEKRNCQIQFTSYSGQTFFGQLEGTAIDGFLPRSATCYLAVIDISERIEAVAKLEETKERLELALEASDAGTWEYDYATGKIFLNDSSFGLCGIDNITYTGEYHSFLDIVHSNDRYMVDQHLRTCINHEKEVDIEFTIVRNKEKCHVSMRGHLIRRPENVKRFVGTIMDISEKKRLESEAQQLKVEQQRNITKAIITTEATERKRISESLHAGVCQLLYGIKLNIQQMGALKSPDDPLANMSKLVDLAIKETRNIAFELAPSILNDFGLPITIEEICKRLSTPRLTIRSETKGLNKRLSSSLETCVFRMIQDLINNAIKHSGAGEVVVKVNRGHALEITVTDNGKGFDPESLTGNTQGTGLRNVSSKAKLYDGTVDVKSQPGKGTCVKIVLNKLTD
ncbi:PAS domain S-box protein [Arcticibacter sp.]|uniref:PAS domain-containing sensor histidine kinase n=1 Tax=Arcticibacter sp. TaxID=1872630 RepID=UPI00388E75FD